MAETENKIAKVLVSACLTGRRVRYDGAAVSDTHRILKRWEREGRVVPFCPEVAGGLPVPRPPAEIVCEHGKPFPDGDFRVLNARREDVTEHFLKGAREAAELARSLKIGAAVMKDGSPSCGSRYVYDGSFSGSRRPGIGVTCSLLKTEGVRVFTEGEFEEADAYLRKRAGGP